MKTWHERLREAFNGMPEEKKMTKKALADKLGIKPSSVSDWFTETTKEISGENLLNLCDALEIDPHWLMFGKVQKKSGQKAEGMEERDRACITKQEGKLLEIFRTTSENGKRAIIAAAQGIQISSPITPNVVVLPSYRKHRKPKK